MIEAESVSLTVGGRRVVDGVSLCAREGEVTVVTGPNGAGKSTLFRVLSGERAPHEGTVRLHGVELSRWKPRALARARAVMTQRPSVAFAFTAMEVVLLGRTPHGDGAAPSGLRAAERSLARAGASDFAERIVSTLSGGEQQRVFLARALAQVDGATSPCLLLDEPTAHLDVAQQARLLSTLRSLAEEGATVVAVIHELPLALRYADAAALMSEGRVVAAGPVVDTLTDEALSAAYGTALQRMGTPGRPGCTVEPVEAGEPPRSMNDGDDRDARADLAVGALD